MISCLRGAYDLHVHSGPDIVRRKLDDPEACRRYLDAGFRGYCIKSHYFCTAERARIMNSLFPQLNILGAISLNHTVGGLNPEAVDAAGRDGAKFVWLPTFDASNEIGFTFGERCTYDTMPAWAIRMLERREKGEMVPGITVLQDGKLTEPAKAVLRTAAQHHMVVCTGHLSKMEIAAVVKSASGLGLKNVVVTHAAWASIALTKEEQLALAEKGAIIEQCSANMKPAYGITWEGMYEALRCVGPKNCIISSDCGNLNKPYPDLSLEKMAENLLANGFTEEEVRMMAVINTTRLAEE